MFWLKIKTFDQGRILFEIKSNETNGEAGGYHWLSTYNNGGNKGFYSGTGNTTNNNEEELQWIGSSDDDQPGYSTWSVVNTWIHMAYIRTSAHAEDGNYKLYINGIELTREYKQQNQDGIGHNIEFSTEGARLYIGAYGATTDSPIGSYYPHINIKNILIFGDNKLNEFIKSVYDTGPVSYTHLRAHET